MTEHKKRNRILGKYFLNSPLHVDNDRDELERIVAAEIKKSLYPDDLSHQISPLLLTIVDLLFNMDTLVINCSDPIVIFRSRDIIKNFSADTENGRLITQAFIFCKKPFTVVASRFIQRRPKYYDEKNTSLYLEKSSSHFQYFKPEDGKKPLPWPFPSILSTEELGSLQVYQIGHQLATEYKDSEAATLFFDSNGKARQDLKRKTSSKPADIAWGHFTESGGFRRCNECDNDPKKAATIYAITTSLSVLKKHLATHDIKFINVNNDSEAIDLTESRSESNSLNFQKLKSKNLSKEEWKEILEDAIIESSAGASLVAAPWFMKFVSKVSASNTLPSESTARRWIQQRFPLFLRARAEYLQSLTNNLFWFTLDGWSDVNLRSFYWFTIHYIDPESGTMFGFILDCLQVAGGEGSSKRLGDQVIYSLESNGITKKTAGITSDNANDAVAVTKYVNEQIGSFTRNGKVESIRCFNHVLGLGNEVLRESLLPYESKLKALIVAIRMAKSKRKKFGLLSKDAGLSTKSPPPIPSNVKWTSAFRFLNECVVKRIPLEQMIICFEELRQYQLNHDEWNKIIHIRNFQADLIEWKNLMEPSNSPTMNKLNIIFGLLEKKLTLCDPQTPGWLQTAAKKMNKDVIQVYKDLVFETKTSMIAMFLDVNISVSKRSPLKYIVLQELERFYGYSCR